MAGVQGDWGEGAMIEEIPLQDLSLEVGHQKGGHFLAQSLGHPHLPTQCSAPTRPALRHVPSGA